MKESFKAQSFKGILPVFCLAIMTAACAQQGDIQNPQDSSQRQEAASTAPESANPYQNYSPEAKAISEVTASQLMDQTQPEKLGLKFDPQVVLSMLAASQQSLVTNGASNSSSKQMIISTLLSGALAHINNQKSTSPNDKIKLMALLGNSLISAINGQNSAQGTKDQLVQMLISALIGNLSQTGVGNSQMANASGMLMNLLTSFIGGNTSVGSGQVGNLLQTILTTALSHQSVRGSNNYASIISSILSGAQSGSVHILPVKNGSLSMKNLILTVLNAYLGHVQNGGSGESKQALIALVLQLILQFIGG